MPQIINQLRIDVEECDTPWVEMGMGSVPLGSPHWCVYYNSQVSAALEYDGKTTVLEPSGFYLIPPGTEGYAHLLATFSHFYIYFSVNNDDLDVAPGIYKVPAADFVLEVIKELIGMDPSTRKQGAGALFCQLVASYSISRLMLGEIENEIDPRILAALTYLQAYYAEEISITELAEEHSLTREAFSRLFKNETGESPYQFVTKLRMNKARLLLEGSDKMMIDIARSIGYKDQYQFSKAFKRWTQLSPTDYRNRHRLAALEQP